VVFFRALFLAALFFAAVFFATFFFVVAAARAEVFFRVVFFAPAFRATAAVRVFFVAMVDLFSSGVPCSSIGDFRRRVDHGPPVRGAIATRSPRRPPGGGVR
jgi:hypothetical protein